MSDDRKALDLVERALDLPSGERTAFLDRECGDDAETRAQVDDLLDLAARDEADGFLTPPAREDLERLFSSPPEDLASGTRLGRYQLIRHVASGGMASVYEASQENPTRRVALKLLKLDLADQAMQRRFASEAEILAFLQHPGIAEVYEAGVAELEGGPKPTRHPFIAMEFLPGARSITEHARVEGLSREHRLELFASVCDAVHHAHRKGVIHRDLKPANILVDDQGRAKVIDFGVARATHGELEQRDLTLTGQVLGTPVYMSPEQFTASSLDLDVRTDVYSLGVVLYELLCEEQPFDLRGKPLHEVARAIAEDVPVRPSLRMSDLSGDLDAILGKALEKDPDRRYGSVSELEEDLRHHLAREPIAARPPSVTYRARRFVQRNRLLVGSAAVLAVSLVAATAVSLHYAFDAIEQRDVADQARQDEVAQRARAESLFHGSLGIHVEFLQKYVGRIRRLSGASRLSADMMESIAANLERVRAESEEDPKALILLSEAWLLLGRQRARSQGSHISEYEEGRRNYENALTLVRRVRAAHPDRLDATLIEGRLLLAMGDLAVSQNQMDEAKRWYEQRFELAQQTEARDEDPEQLIALASSYDRIGGLSGMSGDHAGALSAFEVSLELSERIVELAPSSSALRRRATAQGRVAGAMLELGRYEESVALYSEQVAVLDELLVDDPNAASLKAQRVVVIELRSRAQIALGQLDEAESCLKEALEDVQSLIASDPDDARLPVFEIIVTFGRGSVEGKRAESEGEGSAREHWQVARSWFERCEQLILERKEKGLLQPAEMGFLGSARAQIARCDEHL